MVTDYGAVYFQCMLGRADQKTHTQPTHSFLGFATLFPCFATVLKTNAELKNQFADKIKTKLTRCERFEDHCRRIKDNCVEIVMQTQIFKKHPTNTLAPKDN